MLDVISQLFGGARPHAYASRTMKLPTRYVRGAVIAAIACAATSACSATSAPAWTYPAGQATARPAPTPLMRPGLTALPAGRYTETCLRPALALTVPDGLHVLIESADTL